YQNAEQHIILPYSLTEGPTDDTTFSEIPAELFDFVLESTQANEKVGGVLKRVERSTYPIASLLAASPGLGYIGADEDADGIFRHYPLIANIDSLYVPSYSLLAYSRF